MLELCLALMLILPSIGLLREILSNARLIERHHRHHDVYTAQGSLLFMMVAVNVFMGLFGLLFCWFISFGSSHIHPIVPAAFFTSFIIIIFGACCALSRYQVATYNKYLLITPFVGPKHRLVYADIASMKWGQPFEIWGYQGLKISCSKGQGAYIWGALDVDQILLNINRFDVLEGLQGKSNPNSFYSKKNQYF